jgi:hypothetical protein
MIDQALEQRIKRTGSSDSRIIMKVLERSFQALFYVGTRLWKVKESHLVASAHVARALSELSAAIEALKDDKQITKSKV